MLAAFDLGALRARLWPVRSAKRTARAPGVLAEYDRGLVWTALLLLVLGLVMVYSASITIAEAGKAFKYQPTYFLTRQIFYVIVGVALALLAFQVPSRTWQEVALWLFVLGVVLLILVFIPGVSRPINGARRWISLGFVNVQPSEFMKLFAVLYAADFTARKAHLMHSFKKGLLPMVGVMLPVGVLLLFEPDYGATFVIVLIAAAILFIGGMNVRWFVGLIAVLAVAFAALIAVSSYRLSRFLNFMDPWADAFGRGYQLTHSLIAFGRGEWFGVGLGASIEKHHYLTEAHTDFLLAVIAEELGFVGVVVVVLLFAWLVTRAFVVGRLAVSYDRPFASLAAQGIGLWFGAQACIHMGVNMGLLPTKGLTLPFMSFGGSSIVANCIALGILMRIDWENRQLMRGLPA
jgi:cell division protein FtsW